MNQTKLKDKDQSYLHKYETGTKTEPCIGCFGCPPDCCKDQNEQGTEPPQFKINDKVFCLLYGNGHVNDIYIGKLGDRAVQVSFPFGMLEEYDTKGILYGKTVRRTLFHGHNLFYEIHEEQGEPEWRWANLYSDEQGQIQVSKGHKTKQKAINAISDDYNFTYINTIQIKPFNYKPKIQKVSYNALL
jgi:hypothetical protein